jgi:hypothetical protein
LVVVGATVIRCATLELNRKDCRAADQDGIDATAEARDVELQVDRARNSYESAAEDLDFFLPGVALASRGNSFAAAMRPRISDAV